MKFHLEIEMTPEEAEHPWRLEEKVQGVAYGLNQFVYESDEQNIKYWFDPKPALPAEED
jgi:hypothetical protein